jgi:hypothetical protein
MVKKELDEECGTWLHRSQIKTDNRAKKSVLIFKKAEIQRRCSGDKRKINRTWPREIRHP